MKNNAEQLAMDIYSILSGHDYMTSSPIETAEEFGHDYSEARKYIEKNPELKEVVGYFVREKTGQIKRMKEQRDAARCELAKLRNRYNELCEETDTDDFIEEYYF